jgi:phosphatidate cytidylyltransferase
MKDFTKRILSSIILLPIALYFMLMGSFYLIFLIIICFLVSSFEWNKMTKKLNEKLSGFIFLIFSFYSFYQLAIDYTLLVPFFICVATDIGGYVFGKIFKGPKLTKISPNKTYAGMIGGYFLSILFISLYFDYINYKVTITLFITTILISSVSQIGDIIISFFKRKSKVKNTGNLIPGHGGLLDRIDGMIFAFPIYYLIQLTGYLA